MDKVQQTICTLRKAWADEGRAPPLLDPFNTTREERFEFAARHGIGPEELLLAFREIVERGERAALEDWSPDVKN